MRILVKPSGEDRRVPMPPRTTPPRYFGADPAEVELDQYIQRRLDDGDLVQVKSSTVPAPTPAPTPAKEG